MYTQFIKASLSVVKFSTDVKIIKIPQEKKNINEEQQNYRKPIIC